MRLLFSLLLITTSLIAQTPKDWTTPLDPFKIVGNLYYVGSRDLAVYLVVTPKGNILINSNLESSPPQIRHSVEQLGFKWGDTKILLSSQAHYDHAAGAAQILRETHAAYEVMQGDVDVVESGGKTSFDLPDFPFPAAHVARTLHDGDKITLGDTTITALRTAGHTRGCTTFTMTVDLNDKKLLAAIICGWSSNPGVSYVPLKSKPAPGSPASSAGGSGAFYPGIEQDFEHTFATYEALPVDIFLGAHGVYFNMLTKLDKGARSNPALWIDREGYKAAIRKADEGFHRELAKQKAAAK